MKYTTLFIIVLITISCDSASTKEKRKSAEEMKIDSAKLAVRILLEKEYSSADLDSLKLTAYKMSHYVWNEKLANYANQESKEYFELYKTVIGSDSEEEFKYYYNESLSRFDSLIIAMESPDTLNTYYVVNGQIVKMDTILNKDFYITPSFEVVEIHSK